MPHRGQGSIAQKLLSRLCCMFEVLQPATLWTVIMIPAPRANALLRELLRC